MMIFHQNISLKIGLFVFLILAFQYTFFSLSNAQGTKNKSFNCGDIITDIDGHKYETVQIGNQCWMTENLRTSRYANGDTIPRLKGARKWKNANKGAWSYYNNRSRWNDVFGKLYNWHAVSDIRGVCPDGWHVPSYYEWDALEESLDGNTIAGGKIKKEGSDLWFRPNIGATNVTNFTALPGGKRDYSGSFRSYSVIRPGESGFWWTGKAGEAAYWWTSSYHSDNPELAWGRFVYYKSIRITSLTDYKESGLSIRCIKSDE